MRASLKAGRAPDSQAREGGVAVLRSSFTPPPWLRPTLEPGESRGDVFAPSQKGHASFSTGLASRSDLCPRGRTVGEWGSVPARLGVPDSDRRGISSCFRCPGATRLCRRLMGVGGGELRAAQGGAGARRPRDSGGGLFRGEGLGRGEWQV